MLYYSQRIFREVGFVLRGRVKPCETHLQMGTMGVLEVRLSNSSSRLLGKSYASPWLPAFSLEAFLRAERARAAFLFSDMGSLRSSASLLGFSSLFHHSLGACLVLFPGSVAPAWCSEASARRVLPLPFALEIVFTGSASAVGEVGCISRRSLLNCCSEGGEVLSSCFWFLFRSHLPLPVAAYKSVIQKARPYKSRQIRKSNLSSCILIVRCNVIYSPVRWAGSNSLSMGNIVAV